MAAAHLQQLFTGQVPLLDVIVSGAAVENVSVHGERLHAVLVSGLKRMAGADAALSTLCHLKRLEKDTCTPTTHSVVYCVHGNVKVITVVRVCLLL